MTFYKYLSTISRLKKLTALIILLIALILLGAWAGIKFTDFNKYKTNIEQKFFEEVGYKLIIEGNIIVTPFPFKITFIGLKVPNKSGFESELFAEVSLVNFSLSAWQLFFNQKVIIKSLIMEQANFYLETNAQGENNWNTLIKTSSISKNPQPHFSKVNYLPVAQTAPQTSNKPEYPWQMKSFIAQGSAIHWKDSAHNKSWAVTKLNLTAFDMKPNTNFYFLSEFDFETNQNPAVYQTKLSSQLKIDNALNNWQLSDWQGTIKASLPRAHNIPELRLETSGILLEFDNQKQSLEVVDVQLNSPRGNISTSFKSDFVKHTKSQGHLSSVNIDLKKWFRHAGINLPTFVKDDVFDKASLEVTWQLDHNNLMLQNIKMQWDESQLQGKIISSNLANPNENPNINFDISIDKLNLDAYEAVKTADIYRVEKTDKLTETFLPLAIPISTLRSTNIEGNLKIDQFQAWGIKFENMATTIFGYKGQLNLAPLDANLYQGKLNSKLSLNVNGKTPSYSWSGRVKNIDLKPFLKAGWKYNDLAGNYNGQFSLLSKGVNGDLLKKNSSGKFNASIKNGSYKSKNISKFLQNKTQQKTDKTDFSFLNLKGSIHEGIFNIQKLNFLGDDYSVIGTGDYDLARNHLNAKLFTSHKDIAEEIAVQLQGKTSKLNWTIKNR